MQIIYLVLVLSVCKANASFFDLSPSCDELAKGSDSFCDYFSKHLKNKQLADASCDCLGGVFVKNTYLKDKCIKSANHFKDAPNCRDLIKSGAYAKIFNDDSVRALAKTMLTTFANVCSSSSDQTQANIGNIFTSFIFSIPIETGILVGIPDHGVQINLCYKDIRDLITN